MPCYYTNTGLGVIWSSSLSSSSSHPIRSSEDSPFHSSPFPVLSNCISHSHHNSTACNTDILNSQRGLCKQPSQSSRKKVDGFQFFFYQKNQLALLSSYILFLSLHLVESIGLLEKRRQPRKENRTRWNMMAIIVIIFWSDLLPLRGNFRCNLYLDWLCYSFYWHFSLKKINTHKIGYFYAHFADTLNKAKK